MFPDESVSTSHRVVFNQKDILFPRIGVPVESSESVSRHIDVSLGVQRYSIRIVIRIATKLSGPLFCPTRVVLKNNSVVMTCISV